MGGAIVAVIGGALLADAAVETAASGSPVRWWTIGAVVVYVVLTALTWRRRIDWPQRLGVLGVVFYALLSATAWRPDGLTDGVRLLGQPTAVVLSGATIVALIVAAVGLLRASVLPLAVRLVLALFALYGLAAFALAASQPVAYASLFHGASLWQAAPRWLQGSIVGGLVVLPAALLVGVARDLRRGTRGWHPQQFIAIALALVMVVSGITNGAGATGVQSSSTPVRSANDATPGGLLATAAPVSTLSPEQITAAVDLQFRAVEAFAAAVPRDTFDPAAVLSRTGRDTTTIFHWVRDNTLWVPYAGVLRGPVGVLMDRRGNDLDRALLLAHLLKLAGRQVRLARGDTSDDTAAEMLRGTPPGPADLLPPTRDVAPDVTALLDQYAKDNPAPTVGLRQLVKRLLDQEASMTREATERSARQAKSIATMVNLAPSRPTPLAAVRDHWWVQVADGDRWTDLDPATRDSEPGRSRASARTTTDAPDAASYHEVEIRVIAERWEQGQVREMPLLSHVVRPSEMDGTSVSLFHVPIDWPTDRLRGMAERGPSQHEWLPVLQVGSKLVYQSSITDRGVKGEARPGLGTTIERGLEGVSAMFNAPAESNASVLTAEWIEYEVRSPGESPRTIRRQLFDTIGAAQRNAGRIAEPRLTESARTERAMALMGKTDILVAGHELSRAFVAHQFAEGFLANREALLHIATAPRGDDQAIQRALAEIRPLPSPQLYGLALARFAWSADRGDVYIARPTILTTHQEVHQAEGGAFVATNGFDIVANDVAVRPGSTADPSTVRLRQGVTDTVSEAVLASRGLDRPGPQSTTVVNVSDMYREAGNQRIDFVTVRSGDDPASRNVNLGTEAGVRLGGELAAGYIVLAPARKVMLNGRPAIGWWRIDAATGTTLGVDERGWGAAIPEWAWTLAHFALCAAGGTALLGGVSAKASGEGGNATLGLIGALGIMMCIGGAGAELAGAGLEWGGAEVVGKLLLVLGDAAIVGSELAHVFEHH